MLSTLALSIFAAKYYLLASKLQCMMTAKEDTKLEFRAKAMFYSQIAYTTVASIFFVYFYLRYKTSKKENNGTADLRATNNFIFM